MRAIENINLINKNLNYLKRNCKMVRIAKPCLETDEKCNCSTYSVEFCLIGALTILSYIHPYHEPDRQTSITFYCCIVLNFLAGYYYNPVIILLP